MTRSASPQLVSRRAALVGLGAAGLCVALGSTAGTAAAQDVEVELQSEIVYGADDPTQAMSAIRPKDRSAPVPAIVLIHGGSFVQGSRNDDLAFASNLAKAGYAAFSVDYRLFNPSTGTNAWPAALDDVQRAVRWLQANATEQGIDPERIGAFGHSTGGHLAAFLGTRATRDNTDPALAKYPSTVACVVDMSGETDFTIRYYNRADSILYAALLGGSASEPPSKEAYQDLSPITFVRPSTAPFLIIHGGADFGVPVGHSRNMEAALHTAGVEVTYAEFPGLGHLEVFDWSLVGTLMLAFLDRHLKPAVP
jgi:acetyl esterase/lipase